MRKSILVALLLLLLILPGCGVEEDALPQEGMSASVTIRGEYHFNLTADRFVCQQPTTDAPLDIQVQFSLKYIGKEPQKNIGQSSCGWGSISVVNADGKVLNPSAHTADLIYAPLIAGEAAVTRLHPEKDARLAVLPTGSYTIIARANFLPEGEKEFVDCTLQVPCIVQ